MEKKTPLYDKHVAAGGKMVPFAGYLMPVQYGAGVIAEHTAVRTRAGLFDVSHMGELWLLGPGALPTVQMLLTNDMDGMENGDCRYSPMCNDKGGVVDDLIVYKVDGETYLLVVNAGNHDKDVEWVENHLVGDVKMEDRSGATGQIALQGPMAETILAKIAGGALPAENYTFVPELEVAGMKCIVSRTGYTGEDGFEIYCPAAATADIWDAVLKAGEGEGLIPCGLGARDTLRLEAGMPLYGHEMTEDISPLQAMLGFFVKMDKADFIGKAALEAAGKPARRRSALKMTGRGIAREGSPVYSGDKEVGWVTSGTQLPTVGYAGAMAIIDEDCRPLGTQLSVDVRGRKIEAEVIKAPFYKREK